MVCGAAGGCGSVDSVVLAVPSRMASCGAGAAMERLERATTVERIWTKVCILMAVVMVVVYAIE